jgi:hypothetical protein
VDYCHTHDDTSIPFFFLSLLKQQLNPGSCRGRSAKTGRKIGTHIAVTRSPGTHQSIFWDVPLKKRRAFQPPFASARPLPTVLRTSLVSDKLNRLRYSLKKLA